MVFSFLTWDFLFSPPPPHLTSKFFLPVSGPVPFLPRSPHFPSLFTRDVSGSGWQECGLNPGPACPAGVVAHLVQGAGCQALGIWGHALSRFAGSLVSCKKKKKKSLKHNFVHSFFRGSVPAGRHGHGRPVGREGSRYSFQVRPTRSLLAPSPKGHD